MYAFRPPKPIECVKERKKAVVLHSLPFSTIEVGRFSQENDPTNDNLSNPPSNLPSYELVPAKSIKSRSQWTVVGIGDAYHTFHARRATKGGPCVGDWSQMGSLTPDLPHLIMNTRSKMCKGAALSMTKTYFQLYQLVELMWLDRSFVFHLRRHSSRHVQMNKSGGHVYRAKACADAETPEEFVQACVGWLLMLEGEMRRFQTHASPGIKQLLARHGLDDAGCLRNGGGSFTNDTILATQLFFQFLKCYAVPTVSERDVSLVRPVPWAIDNVQTRYLPLTKKACAAYHLPLHFCKRLPSTDTLWYHVPTMPNATFLLTLPSTFVSGGLVQPDKYLNVPKPSNEMRLSREQLRAGLICVFSAGTCAGYYVLDRWEGVEADMIRLMRLGK